MRSGQRGLPALGMVETMSAPCSPLYVHPVHPTPIRVQAFVPLFCGVGRRETWILKFRAASSQRHLAAPGGRPPEALAGSCGDAGAQLRSQGTGGDCASWGRQGARSSRGRALSGPLPHFFLRAPVPRCAPVSLEARISPQNLVMLSLVSQRRPFLLHAPHKLFDWM